MPYWPQPTEWNDRVVHVPLEDLAQCVMGLGKECLMADGSVETLSAQMVLGHWAEHGPKLDGYILTQPSGRHCAGVRYGAEGPDYLSPYCDSAKLGALLAKFQKAAPPDDQSGRNDT